jgi:hypothetical protein
MERKSGFKECPRCGLRNKPSAPQCDFCGWEFKDASDEWISHVQVLEKMSREAEPIVIDEQVSKRIESTIIRDRKESLPPITIRQAPPSEPIVITEHPEQEEETAIRKEMPPVPPPTPAPLEEEEIKAFTETMVGPTAEPMAAAPDPVFAQPNAAPEGPVVRRREQVRFTHSHWTLPMVLTGTGTLIYLIGIIALGSAFLSTAVGWALAITGALCVTTGANFAYDIRLASKAAASPTYDMDLHGDDEVFICPKCHEQVRKADDRCPGCGAKFRKAV